jgi:hypothetical protein
MATKHNTEVNNDPLKREYFDDVLDLFYDINEKNEQLYEEIHKTFTDNQPTGFTLGTSKSTVDLTRTLSDLRSNSIQSATALLNAKRTVAELELKKKAQSVEEEKVNNDKEYIRNVISEISTMQAKKRESGSRELIDSKNRTTVNILDDIKREKETELLEANIQNMMDKGALSLTKNEKAMKYDFNGEAEVVYDLATETVKAVKKGTSIELPDYPVERGQVGEINRIERDEGMAYSDNGKKIRITTVVNNN